MDAITPAMEPNQNEDKEELIADQEARHKKKLYVLDQESPNLNKLRADQLAQGKHIWEIPRQFFWYLQNYKEDNDTDEEEPDEEDKQGAQKIGFDYFIQKEKEILAQKAEKKKNEAASDSVAEITAKIKHLQ